MEIMERMLILSEERVREYRRGWNGPRPLICKNSLKDPNVENFEEIVEPVRDPRIPYQVRTPRALWFVPEDLYMICSEFSKEMNLYTLSTKFDIGPSEIKISMSTKTVIVFEKYFYLSLKIRSFLDLQPSGLYLHVVSRTWKEPPKNAKRKELDKSISNFHDIYEKVCYIDKIARLIQSNYDHFGKDEKNLKDINFTIDISVNDHNYLDAAKKVRAFVCKIYERQAYVRNLDWKFKLTKPGDTTDAKFHIGIQMNSGSFFIGLRLLSWEDSYAHLHSTKKYGDSIADYINFLDIQDGMTVLDVEVCLGENLMELAKIPKCHAIGLLKTEGHAKAVLDNLGTAQNMCGLKCDNFQLIISQSYRKIPGCFDPKVVDRVLFCPPTHMDAVEIDEFMSHMHKFMDNFSTGCIFLFVLPYVTCFESWVKDRIQDNPKFEVHLNRITSELHTQRRVILISIV
ncbi:hypothetical protein CRE_17136 [Caenorhabditis remanei]|uniref:Uncharacterized protein n=1 Tax=Caenorhabditis remanei TaxID=31234 RepID=E3MAB2_CAERE|nr:hypothetical protein CRE_17136 [Caenorhabditis remanei]